MWNYERRLQYPVNITKPNARIAQIIISQYGGPDGEAAASFRYLSQRFSMPYRKVAGLLTDIGTEELAHLEMVGAIVRQLTKGLSAEELEAQALRLTMSTILQESGHRLPEESRSTPASSSPKAMRSQTYLKIWLQNRKRVRPMTISSVWSKTRKSATRSVS